MKTIITRSIRHILNLTLLFILLFPSSLGEAGGSGWFVNTIDDLDDGICDAAHCSLREAINISNATVGQQIIAFDILSPGPHIIELCDVLPAITDSVLVDGTLEPDYPYNGGPVVALTPGQGSACAAPPYGLWIEGSNSVVRGMSVAGFDQPGAPISGGIILHAGSGSTIERNFIGLLPGGIPLGNRNGILLGAADHQIQENIISGNTYGIHALLGGQTIIANRIGTDPDAMSTSLDLRNTIGIYIEQGADNNYIGLSGTGNVISGNGNGIYLASQGNQIHGNMIGTNRTGTSALGNSIGIHASQTTYTVIGGPDPGKRNVISGNISGISLGGYSTVQGNLIGTNSSGSAAIPNQTGISVQSASYVLIGGTGSGQGNVISGNSNAGIILHDFATHVEVVSNKIGTDISGTNPLGNGRGIFIQGNGNFIGHVATGGGNTIAYNSDEGVLLAWSASQNRVEVNTIHDNGVGVYAMDDTTSANPFTQNIIYGNTTLGLDLAPWGVNLNDAGDGDSGANLRLNYPEFTTVSSTTAEGTACPGCTVEVYRSDTDPSGYGEGEALIESVVVGLYGDFTLTYPYALATCDRITATTTDVFGNTSEFSPNSVVGLCAVLDPSWFFLVEITIFIIIWFAILVIGRRAGRPIGGAAAAGGAAGLVAALGAFGLMSALPNVELNLPRGASPEIPSMLPACERFLAPESMLPMEGARGMPPFPLGQVEMPPDPLGQDVGPKIPVVSYGHLNLSWMPIDFLKDDGVPGGSTDSVSDDVDGESDDGDPVPWADVDQVKDDGAAASMVDGGVKWRVDLIGPAGVMVSRVTTWNSMPLSAFLINADGMKFDGVDGESQDSLMVNGQDWDTTNPLGFEGVDGQSQDSVMVNDQDYDTTDPLGFEGVDGQSQDSVMVNDQDWDTTNPLGFEGVDGESQDSVMVEDQDYDTTDPLTIAGIPGGSTDFLSFDGIDGESQDYVMVNGQDYDVEPFFWRLTGYAPSGDGSLQPFCLSTNWRSFQLGAFGSPPAIPWLASAPPAPLPPAPSEPTSIAAEGETLPESCTPTFTAAMNTTCRFGPASVYHELGYLLQGESATVEGRNADSTWWWIPNPDWQGYCWVWDGGGDAICIPENLQVIAAPPLPTPTPTPLPCTSDLGPDACAAAGGSYVDGGATKASVCKCP